MSDLPPLPKGFVLDGEAPQANALPPLPNGFSLDAPQNVNPAVDFFKSVPHGVLSGLSGAMSSMGKAAYAETGDPAEMPNAQETADVLEKNITGQLPRPAGRAGQFGAAAGEMLGNPLSYLGPGSLPLKLGAAVLSGLGSEGGRQIGEGTALETPLQIAGGLAGGIAAGKMLGPAAERAAIPTIPELKRAEDFAYTAARNSGVEVHPVKFGDWAAQQEQNLTTGPKYAFTGGPDGTAPRTLKLLEKIQNPPEGATITASNLDTLRRQINDIAGETKDFKPTADAKAAMVLKREFSSYLENPPQGHIVAGNAEDFVRNIKEGNATHGALQNTKTINQKIINAQDNTEGSIAASLSNQLKSQLRPILRNPKAQRGLTQEEIAAVRGVNRGTVASNVLSQVGRLGAGVIPAIAHAGTAIATGGASLPAQIATAVPLYIARKAGERMTLAQAKRLQDLMAMRSPLYQQRLNALPPPDFSANTGAMARGILGGLR